MCTSSNFCGTLNIIGCNHLSFRTERNVHLFLVDVGSGEEYSVSSSTSGRITFIFQSDFHQGQVINIGGVPNGDYAIEVRKSDTIIRTVNS